MAAKPVNDNAKLLFCLGATARHPQAWDRGDFLVKRSARAIYTASAEQPGTPRYPVTFPRFCRHLREGTV